MRKFTAVFTLLSLVPVGAWASDAYNFGGGCASMGAWSQDALAQTQQIEQVVDKLKNNKDCQGIESVIGDLKAAESGLGVAPEQRASRDRLESIPSEEEALRGSASDPSLKEPVTKLLVDRTLEEGELIPEVASAAGGEAAFAMAASSAAQTGMQALDEVLRALPSYDKCLNGMPDQGIALLGASIKLAAAY